MRPLLLALLLTAPAAAADRLTVQTGVSAGAVALNALFLPFRFTMSRPPVALAPYPYFAGEEGWPTGDRELFQRAEVSVRALTKGRVGTGLRYRATSANHLTFEVFGDYYRQPRPDVVLRWLGAGVRGEIARGPRGLWEWMLGGAGMSGSRSHGGPRLGLAGEWFPRSPVVVEAEAALTVPGSGVPLGDFFAGAGVELGPLEVRAGGRALVGQLVPLAGPELAVVARF